MASHNNSSSNNHDRIDPAASPAASTRARKTIDVDDFIARSKSEEEAEAALVQSHLLQVAYSKQQQNRSRARRRQTDRDSCVQNSSHPKGALEETKNNSQQQQQLLEEGDASVTTNTESYTVTTVPLDEEDDDLTSHFSGSQSTRKSSSHACQNNSTTDEASSLSDDQAERIRQEQEAALERYKQEKKRIDQEHARLVSIQEQEQEQEEDHKNNNITSDSRRERDSDRSTSSRSRRRRDRGQIEEASQSASNQSSCASSQGPSQSTRQQLTERQRQQQLQHGYSLPLELAESLSSEQLASPPSLEDHAVRTLPLMNSEDHSYAETPPNSLSHVYSAEDQELLPVATPVSQQHHQVDNWQHRKPSASSRSSSSSRQQHRQQQRQQQSSLPYTPTSPTLSTTSLQRSASTSTPTSNYDSHNRSSRPSPMTPNQRAASDSHLVTSPAAGHTSANANPHNIVIEAVPPARTKSNQSSHSPYQNTNTDAPTSPTQQAVVTGPSGSDYIVQGPDYVGAFQVRSLRTRQVVPPTIYRQESLTHEMHSSITQSQIMDGSSTISSSVRTRFQDEYSSTTSMSMRDYAHRAQSLSHYGSSVCGPDDLHPNDDDDDDATQIVMVSSSSSLPIVEEPTLPAIPATLVEQSTMMTAPVVRVRTPGDGNDGGNDPSSSSLPGGYQKQTKTYVIGGLCIACTLGGVLFLVVHLIGLWDELGIPIGDDNGSDSSDDAKGMLGPMSEAPSIIPTTMLPTMEPTLVPTAAPTPWVLSLPNGTVDAILSNPVEYDNSGTPFRGSPQALAYQWLLEDVEQRPGLPTYRYEQRFALVTLYYATNMFLLPDKEVSWKKDTDWLKHDIDECKWVTDGDGDEKGLPGRFQVCDPETQQYESLALYANDLYGHLPPELSLITSLRYLDFERNNLREDGYGIPSELGLLTSLEYLSLHASEIDGSIPTEVGVLTNLTELHLSQNKLTSVIPTEVGLLSDLQVLALSSNFLSGSLPSEISMALERNLWKFEVDNNKLSGMIPQQYNQALRVRSTNNPGWIKGALPGNPNAVPVVRFNLNDFHGVIPEQFCALQSRLKYNCGTLVKDLCGCNLCPCAADLPTWTIEAIVANPVDNSTDPPSWGSPQARAYHWLLDDLQNLTNLPRNRINQRFALATLFHATNMNLFEKEGRVSWRNSEGWLKHDLDECQWKTKVEPDGFPAPYEICNPATGEYEVLVLHANFLNGNIPPELGMLTSLKHLNLDQNDFRQVTQGIPTELGLLTQLQSISLSDSLLHGNIPTEIGQWRNLNTLRLDNNRFNSHIPTEMGLLSNLKSIFLSKNSLKGSLPSELGVLLQRNLMALELASNSLTGSIPEEYGRALEARRVSYNSTGVNNTMFTIRFDSNDLFGAVPDELCLQQYQLKFDCGALCGCNCTCVVLLGGNGRL